MQPYQLHKLHLCKVTKTLVTVDLVNELDDPEFLERAVQMNGGVIAYAPVRMLSKHLALLAAHRTPNILRHLPSIYKFDRDVVRAACLVDPMCINQVNSFFLLDDIPLFRELVAVNGLCIQYATPKVKLCRDVALAAVAQCGNAFQYLPITWCDQWAFVSLAFKKEPRIFKFASCRIKDTEDMALEAIRYATSNFVDVSFRLQNDFTFVAAAVKLDPKVFLYVTNEVLSHASIIMTEAVLNNPWILPQLPHCRVVLEDSALLLQVVQQDGTALQYAPESLRDDPIIALAAVQQHASAYMCLSPRLKSRREIVLATIHTGSQYITDIPSFYYTDEDVIFAAVNSYGVTVSQFPRSVVTKEVALAAVRSAGIALEHMPQWNDDEDVVAAAVQDNCYALSHASEAMQLRRDLVLSTVVKSWHAVKCIHIVFRTDREIATAAIKQHGTALRWMCFSDDAEMCLLALASTLAVYDDFGEDLVTDESFLIKAVRLQPALLPRLPQTLPFWTAALAHSKAHPSFSFFKAVSSMDYEALHNHVLEKWAARCGGCYFLRLKTRLDHHGIYARRLKRAVLEYAGFPFADEWDDVRRAYKNLL